MNNADYWARRLKIMEDALKDQSYEYVKNLEQQFDAAIAQIDTQMRAWYQRFADNNGGISYAERKSCLPPVSSKSLSGRYSSTLRPARSTP